ncbi:hypothetical protein IscW_ISCW015377 [Ixodes scapularis]|uniref:Uncharacterized protein n=1 Tax=Ixodes scapularis TaxID=6945 RepID=B7QMU8_IXOSC|nr:hypothetical protein IscW_ISCW015377 [Ixodes scapularis]|eukprot:XP_002400286.1 hypothetical protein IscW_ISCW015377 [Ixodes scapularis]
MFFPTLFFFFFFIIINIIESFLPLRTTRPTAVDWPQPWTTEHPATGLGARFCCGRDFRLGEVVRANWFLCESTLVATGCCLEFELQTLVEGAFHYDPFFGGLRFRRIPFSFGHGSVLPDCAFMSYFRSIRRLFPRAGLR